MLNTATMAIDKVGSRRHFTWCAQAYNTISSQKSAKALQRLNMFDITNPAEAYLVAVFVLEAHNLIFYGGAVAGALAVGPASILGGLMQVGLYECMCSGCGVRQVARHLLSLNMNLKVSQTNNHLYSFN